MKSKTFRLLNKMMVRTIKQNLMQFIAIIVIGAIAVTLFVGLHANAEVFESQVNQVYEEGNLADLWVTTKSYDKEDFDVIKSFLKSDEAIESRLYLPSESSAHSLFITVVDKVPTICKPFGNIIENGNNTEDDFIYIDNDLMSDSDSYSTLYTLGGDFSFTFDISSYSLSGVASLLEPYVKEGGENIFGKDSIMLTTTVDGTMDHAENITKASYNYSVVLISDKRLERIYLETLRKNYDESIVDTLFEYSSLLLGFNNGEGRMINPNQYVLKLNKNTNIEELKNKIDNYYNQKSSNNLFMITERSGMPFYMTIGSDVKQARNFTYVFPLFFFFVGVLVILTTISQMILKDRTLIGTLKAIGVSKRMIMLHYGALTSTLVLIGTVIGFIVGPLLLPKILGMKYGIIYHLPKATYHFPVFYGILTLVVFIGTALLVTYIIARREIMLKPSESMRPRVVSFKSHKKKGILKKNKFFSFKMAYRNISINLGKSIMVIVGVLGCTALLVSGFGIENTLTYGIDNDLGMFYSSDLTIVLNNYKTEEELDKDFIPIKDGLEYYEYSIHSATTAYKTSDAQAQTNVYIIPDDSIAVKIDCPIDSAVISESVAKKLGASKGDKVHFAYNSIDYTVTISDIYQAFYYNGIVVRRGNPIFKNCLDFRYTIIEAGVIDDSKTEEYLDYFENLSYVNKARTPEHWVEMTNKLMGGIRVMTNAVKIFAILLGIVVIYNLTLMNFKERSRDIATLKVLGFNQKEIMRSLIIESLSLTLIGVLLGLALGYPFMLAVLENNIVSLVSYLYHIYFKTYIYAFLLTFGVAAVINVLLSLRIRKVRMVESLKSVE